MKKKNSTITLCVKNNNGDTLFHDSINELKIKEDYILEMSCKLFNDKEPCIIHRTFIAKKLYLELFEKLSSFKKSGKLYLDNSEAIELLKNIDINLDNTKVSFE